MELPYIAYLLVLLLIVSALAATPLIAMHGPPWAASLLYNAFANTCHQYIYRSFCVFYDGRSHWLGDCIERNRTAVIATEFTSADNRWDGVFSYSRDQIGFNRADVVSYGGVTGYKVPNDARSFSLYLFALVSGIILPFIWKKPVMPPFLILVLAILPLAIDGTGQLLGFWESTNLVRLATGALAGTGASIFVYPMLSSFGIAGASREAGRREAGGGGGG